MQIEAKRLHLRDEWSIQRRAWFDWLFTRIYRSVGGIVFYLAWTVVILGLGWIGGINTGDTLICGSSKSLCYQMRLRPKLTREQMPKPRCKNSGSGVVCSVEVPTKK